jgi:hypothetical protein
VPKKKVVLPTVSDDQPPKWAWESENPNYSGGAGDVAALFRAEGVETPGVLAIDAPAAEASLFSREAIQNSWDAAKEWERTCKKKGEKPHPFWIEFRFVEYRGFEKRKLVFALGLDEHARQLGAAKVSKGSGLNLGLASVDTLNDLLSGETPLRVLTMTEHGGLGMPGAWRTGDSRMLSALLRVGYTQKAEGAGGSYGYGKAGLIAASAIRTVVTYSAFAEDKSDPGVTRRLLGVTYWKNHSIGKAKFTGWARLGKAIWTTDDEGGRHRSASPYENKEADSAAAELGIAVRNPKEPDDTGTTFMIIDPTIDADDLRSAIQRYWWPAMLNNSTGLRTKIIDFDGTEVIPTVPKDDPHLQPFVRAFELASRSQDTKTKEETRQDLGTYSPHGDEEYPLGHLGLVANTQGWSFPDDNEIDHCTMIALVRGPRMVVNYHTFKGLGIPHIRGAFVSDDSIDDLLRQTEDKAHTKWETKKLAGAHPSAHLVASQVNTRLRKAVLDFKNQFKPPAPRPGDLNLPILDELSRLMKGNKPKPPKPEKRPITIRLVTPAHAVPTENGHLECHAAVEFGVADWVWDITSTETVEVTAILSVAFVEDENLGERLKLRVKPTRKKFVEQGSSNGRSVFVGELGRGETVQFNVSSQAYEPDWTVRFTPTASITNPAISNGKTIPAGDE